MGVLPLSLPKQRGKVKPDPRKELDESPDIAAPLLYKCEEKKPGIYEWSYGDTSSLSTSQLPSSVKVRIFLLEGLSKGRDDLISSLLQVPQDFFAAHEKNTVPSIGAKLDCRANSFFAKWPHYVTQNNRNWEIEKRIDTGRPYNLDTVTDPINLRLDHEWYRRIPRVYRPYDPISSTNTGERGNASLDCISFFWKQEEGGFIGVLVLDPVRKHKIVKKQYNLWGVEGKGSTKVIDCFVDHMNIRERFMEQLEKCNGKDNLSSLRSTIQNIIIQMIVTDSGTILSSLNEALDEIDLSMSQDDILRGSLGEWRNNFGRWRTGLQHQQASLAYVRRVLEAEEPSSKPKGDFVGVVEISDLESGLAATQKRVDGTFQVLMSTMSIIESQKAIAQAETVSKLTYLAFFFIPPTFVTGIFGMNIVEFVGKLKVWIWVTVSLGVSTLAYIFLFWSEIAANARHTPNLVSLNRRRMSAWVAKWFRTIYYLVAEVLVVIFPLALSLGFLAGFGVGLWKLYTSHLSAGAKAGISVAIFLPMLAALIFPLYLQKS